MQHLESHIYPGEYIPEEGSIENTQKRSIYGEMNNCRVNFSENKNYFEINVFLSGINKQDISVELKKKNVFVYVKRFKKNNPLDKEKFLIHEFDNNNILRKIKLPQYADITFISATFQDGLLKLHIPKGSNQVYGKPHFIAIY